jgi:hypothetical protein
MIGELFAHALSSNGSMKNRRRVTFVPLDSLEPKENKPDSQTAGQSGDLQGLSDVEDVDMESVQELVEEGQAFEASAVEGVEDAPEPDVAEVRTRQFRVDDVPPEYLEPDQ